MPNDEKKDQQTAAAPPEAKPDARFAVVVKRPLPKGTVSINGKDFGPFEPSVEAIVPQSVRDLLEEAGYIQVEKQLPSK
jgi:hypothetical protein